MKNARHFTFFDGENSKTDRRHTTSRADFSCKLWGFDYVRLNLNAFTEHKINKFINEQSLFFKKNYTKVTTEAFITIRITHSHIHTQRKPLSLKRWTATKWLNVKRTNQNIPFFFFLYKWAWKNMTFDWKSSRLFQEKKMNTHGRMLPSVQWAFTHISPLYPNFLLNKNHDGQRKRKL